MFVVQEVFKPQRVPLLEHAICNGLTYSYCHDDDDSIKMLQSFNILHCSTIAISYWISCTGLMESD